MDTADRVDSAEFRRVAGHLASGVSIITTVVDGVQFGMTASSVTSLSADPPMMLICINRDAPSCDAISRSGRYAINVLSESQGALARQFAAAAADKFADVQTTTGGLGLPLIVQALAHLECEVVEQVEGGTHTIFLGAVASAAADPREGPLAYFQGGFGRVEFRPDDDAHRQLRELVLARAFAPGVSLEVVQLAKQLQTSQRSIFYALTRLSHEGLVSRDPARGYLVEPFDASMSEETFGARLAIELGVISTLAGPLADFEIEELQKHLAGMVNCLVDGRFVDFEGYFEANHAFHGAVIALARNARLSSLYQDLSVKTVMLRSFAGADSSSQLFIDTQRDLLEALTHGNFTDAASHAAEYCRLAKARAREVLQASGGAL